METFIESIEFCGYEEQQCITIEDPEGLYVTDEGIITHNSTGVLISNLFCSAHIALMYHPWKFFGLAPSTIFCNVLVGSSMKAASQLLAEPFSQFLEQCSFFEKQRSHDAMISSDIEYENSEFVDHLSWTTATKTALVYGSDVYYGHNLTKHIEDVQIGDIIESPTEGRTFVLDIPFEGEDECYELEFENGAKVQCSKDHKWKVSWEKDDQNNPIWIIVTTSFIMNNPQIDFDFFDMS